MAAIAPHRRYTLLAGGSFLVTCALAAALNLFVDPYGLFGSPRIRGINDPKPAASDRIRYVKAYYADRARWRTVLAGNSRVEVGLDPTSPCWSAAEQPVLNLGIPGLGVGDQIAFIEHAEATSEVGRVFLGVDLVDFLVNASTPVDYSAWPGRPLERPFNLRRWMDGTSNPHYGMDRARDWLTGLFSLDTTADSLVTLARQPVNGLATVRADGFNPARDYLPMILHEGQAVLFRQKNAEVVGMLSPAGLDVYQGDRPWSWTFETLDRFLDRARNRGVEVVLFINPYHSEYLAAIGITNKWAALERWKRTLVSIASRHGIQLWDFNVFDQRTNELPPPPGDHSTILRWFWEPAHYRSEYGELMLAQMLGRACAGPGEAALPPGVLLTADDLETHLATLRQHLGAYVQKHPEVAAALVSSLASRSGVGAVPHPATDTAADECGPQGRSLNHRCLPSSLSSTPAGTPTPSVIPGRRAPLTAVAVPTADGP